MFVTLLVYIFFLLIAADVYLFFQFIWRLTKSLLLRSLWFLPTTLLLGALLSFFFSGYGIDFQGIFTVIFIGVSFPKIVFAFITLLDIPFRIFFKWKIYPFTIIAAIVSLLILYVILYGSLIGVSKFTYKEVTFSSTDLPQNFDGLRIVQLSDLHIGFWKDTSQIVKMVEMVNSQSPDLVVITGDLVHYRAEELDGYEDILSQLYAPYGVYSVLGNHDYGGYVRWKSLIQQAENLLELQRRQANMGWKLLNNENVIFAKEEEKIALIGVENNGKPPFHGDGDLPKAMRGTENILFKILLSHDPSHWRAEVIDTDINLTLSGHTHGGQFAIGKHSYFSARYPEWGGLYMENNQGLYINTGIGYAIVPFRFGVLPEITIITLKRKIIQ